MSTLAEIEEVISQLTASELAELEQFVRKTKRAKAMAGGGAYWRWSRLISGRCSVRSALVRNGMTKCSKGGCEARL